MNSITEQIVRTWNENEAKWVEVHGTKEGFEKWFSDQLVKMMTQQK